MRNFQNRLRAPEKFFTEQNSTHDNYVTKFRRSGYDETDAPCVIENEIRWYLRNTHVRGKSSRKNRTRVVQLKVTGMWSSECLRSYMQSASMFSNAEKPGLRPPS